MRSWFVVVVLTCLVRGWAASSRLWSIVRPSREIGGDSNELAIGEQLDTCAVTAVRSGSHEMIGQYLGEKLRQGAILDLGARWFRTRAGLREEDRRTEHGHWDRANRSWRFHSHSGDESSKGS